MSILRGTARAIAGSDGIAVVLREGDSVVLRRRGCDRAALARAPVSADGLHLGLGDAQRRDRRRAGHRMRSPGAGRALPRHLDAQPRDGADRIARSRWRRSAPTGARRSSRTTRPSAGWKRWPSGPPLRWPGCRSRPVRPRSGTRRLPPGPRALFARARAGSAKARPSRPGPEAARSFGSFIEPGASREAPHPHRPLRGSAGRHPAGRVDVAEGGAGESHAAGSEDLCVRQNSLPAPACRQATSVFR